MTGHVVIVGKSFTLSIPEGAFVSDASVVPSVGIDNPIVTVSREITSWGKGDFLYYRTELGGINPTAFWFAHDVHDHDAVYVGEYFYQIGKSAIVLSPISLAVDLEVTVQKHNNIENLLLLIKTCGQVYAGVNEYDNNRERIRIRNWKPILLNEPVPLCWDQAYPSYIDEVQYLWVDICKPPDLTNEFS